MAGEDREAVAPATAPPSEVAAAAGTSKASGIKEKVHVKHLVLDAGALIKGSGYTLASMADNFWTIPEVIAEVRDPRARHHLETLPFELRVRQPTEEAYRAVAAFSRKTGDYPSLSKVDLQVLALTYTIEAEENGTDHLRTEVAARPPLATTPTTPASSRAGVKPVEARQGAQEQGGAPADKDVEEEGIKERLLNMLEEEDEDRTSEEGGDDDEEEDDDDEESSREEEGSEEEEEEVVADNAAARKVVEAGAVATAGGRQADDRFDDAEDEDEEPASEVAAPLPPAAAQAVVASSSSSGIEEEKKTPPPSAPARASAFSWADAVKKAAPPQAPAAPVADQGPAFKVVTQEEQEELDHFVGGLSLQDPSPSSANNSGPVTSRLLGLGGGSCKPLTAADDDLKGWVNPENYKDPTVRRADGFSLGPGACRMGAYTNVDGPLAAACVTTDFAMQNVLLQMGLRLVSVEGMAVRRVKQWARRCDTCAMIIHDPDRLFCSRCGNPYLSKVSISVDHETGKLRVHLGKYYRPRTRGLSFSIPQPGKAGRYDGELLLREDQLLMGAWRQKMIRKKKDVDSMFGSDITETLGMSVKKGAADDVCYGYGRKNPNCQKGRERRGKKKRSNK